MKQKNTPSTTTRLREERLLRGWSQPQLAERLGTTSVTISRWEHGTQQPSPYFRLKLCQLFGKSESELGLFAHVPETTGVMIETEERRHAEKEVAPKETSSLSADKKEETHQSSRTYAHRPGMFKKIDHRQIGITCLLCTTLLLGVLSLFTMFRLQASAGGSHPPSKQQTLGVSTARSDLSLMNTPPTIDDTLTGASTQGSWVVGQHCTFHDQEYQVSTSDVVYCGANSRDFANLAYQIDVTLGQGPQAGIDFRADASSDLYAFLIDASGHYQLLVNAPPHFQILRQGVSSALRQGYHQSNTIGVTVIGATIRLFINHQEVGQLQDTTYAVGYVGVIVGSYHNAQSPTPVFTQASFRNAKIWTIP